MSLREKQINAIKIMLNLNQAMSKSGSVHEPQWKVLVYDMHAQDIISPLLSIRELRDLGVTLHMSLTAYREQIEEAPIVYFLQATEENIRQVCSDFARKLYEAYYINFTGSIPRPMLEDLAAGAVRAGCSGAVSKVFDQYLDFISLEDDMFVLKTLERSPFSFHCLNRGDVKDSEMGPMLDQIAIGLFSVFATLGSVPIIRTARGNAAEHVGEILDRKIRDCLKDTRNTLFMGDPLSQGSLSSGRPLLIIVDRSIDLSTMLHHTWTYQALVHDILQMKLNKVEINDGQKKNQTKNYSLNPTDAIWNQHKNSPFPKVAEAVQEALDTYKSQEGEVRRLKAQLGLEAGADNEEDAAAIAALSHSSTVQTLSSAVSSLPELLEKKRLIDMHTNLATHLLDFIKQRQLDEFFEVEERILAHQTTSLATTMVGERPLLEVLASKEFGSPRDRQRLAVIWQLCNETSSQDFDRMAAALAESEVDDAPLKYIRQWKTFAQAGTQMNQFSAGGGTKTINMFSKLITSSNFVMEGVKNFVVKQRKLPISRVVDNLAEGRTGTSTDDYRYFDPKTFRAATPAGSDGLPKARGPFQDVFVFVVGGGNYIEYANLLEVSKV